MNKLFISIVTVAVMFAASCGNKAGDTREIENVQIEGAELAPIEQVISGETQGNDGETLVDEQQTAKNENDMEKQEETRVKISTDKGDITVRLYDDTPIHRDNFVKLAKEGYYDGTLFHRVIKDFMVQAGDPDSKTAQPGQMLGMGDPGYTLQAEILPNHTHRPGVLAAARQGDYVNPERRSSGSQFYIVTGNASHLDGQYTVFGEVVDGLDVVYKIEDVKTDRADRPIEDVHIKSMKVLK